MAERRARGKQAPQAQISEPLMPGVRMLSFKTAIDGSRAQELDDPFASASLYGQGPGKRKILVPPLGEGSLRNLAEFVEESNILPQCIDAYSVNIDGFGHRFDPIVKEDEGFPTGEVNAATAELEALEEFVAYAYAEGSFVDLRRRTRYDTESTGMGYWEVLRDTATQQIIRLNPVPAHTLRMTTLDPTTVVVTEQRRVGLKLKPVKLSRRFRVFVQVSTAAGKQEVTYFKEFGDPRTLNYKEGTFNGRGDRTNEATEIIAFRTKYNPLSPYSLPRWIGNLPSVLGSRAAEEINLLYFDNKTIPPLIITVSGGMLTKSTIQRITDVLQNQVKGRENFHNALILEAAPPDAAGPQTTSAPRIEVKPLTDRQASDAMFMGYDETNRTKNRSSFRLAPLFVGQSDDYNRATAESSALVVEEQVIRPERMSFDFFMNRWVMPALESRYWKFASLGPNVTLNEDLIQVFANAEIAGAMTPNIGRKILADILEQEVPKIDEPWGDLPFSLTVADARALLAPVLPAPNADGTPPAPPDADTPQKRARLVAAQMIARRLPPEVKRALLADLKKVVKQEIALAKQEIALTKTRG